MPLCHARVDALQRHADEHAKPDPEQHPTVYPVGERASRRRHARIEDVHHHKDERVQGGLRADVLGAQDEEGLAERCMRSPAS